MKHDYTIGNIDMISGSLISCKELAENTVLSIEEMPYSWDTGLLNTVVQWFEVQQVIGERDRLVRFMQKADEQLTATAEIVAKKDSVASTSLDSELSSLNALNSTVSNLLTELSDYAEVQEKNLCCWLNEKAASLYSVSNYVTYNVESGRYVYNWKNISEDLRQNKDISDEDLITILNTLVDDNGNINATDLEVYIKTLATNGHWISSSKAPDKNRVSELTVIVATLERTESYYIKAINDPNTDDTTKKKLISMLSLNNIVVAAAKTVKTTETTSQYCSCIKVDSATNLKYADKSKMFVGDDGNLYCPTQAQPMYVWQKTDKTLDQLKAEGATFEFRPDIRTGGSYYEYVLPNAKTIYTTQVDINISSKSVSYEDELGNTHTSSNGIRYEVSSGNSKAIIYDYSTDKRTVANSFEDEYRKHTERIIAGEISGLKKEEKSIEEAVYDKAKNKIDKDIQKTLKKYALKAVEELVPGFTFVEGVVEDVVSNTYGVYSDSTEVKEYNSKIDGIINDFKEREKVLKRIDRLGDTIASGENDGVSIVIYFDNAEVVIQS
ncbi:MAG: hypothetical protein NC489_12330 [Ruminococcus flavefaciens]|nr:hypothetical protein [Ruminococcus flavefaciens]